MADLDPLDPDNEDDLETCEDCGELIDECTCPFDDPLFEEDDDEELDEDDT